MLSDSMKNVCLTAILQNKRTVFKQEWKKTFILHVAPILGKKKGCWLIILRDLNSSNIMNLFMEKIKPIKAYCN